MFTRRVRSLLLALVIVSVLALTACSGTKESPAGMSTGSGSAAEPVNNGEQVTLTMSIKQSSRLLDLAKQQYEAAHPNVKIEIKEYSAASTMDGKTVIGGKPDPEDDEKFVNSINAELMGGNAADIIAMDGSLPYQKYADKKLFEDLNGYMNEQNGFDPSQYYTNLFKALAYNGGLYTIPIRVQLNFLMGNSSAIAGTNIDDSTWTWNDFKTAAEQITKAGEYAFVNMPPDKLLNRMLESSFGKLFDTQNKTIDTQAIIDLLNLEKSFYDDQLVTGDRVDANLGIFQTFGVSQYDERILFMLTQMAYEGQAHYYTLPSENETRGASFRSDLQIAVNSKSEHKEAAWDFILYLLSEKVQSSRDLMGFSVNKKAEQKRLDQLGADGAGGATVDGQAVSLQAPAPENVEKIKAYLENAAFYAEGDLRIRNIVLEESMAFFNGQKTAKEVAEIVKGKVETYLQE